MASSSSRTQTKSNGSAKPTSRRRKLSPTHKPEEMTLEEWQVALRREYGKEQDFLMENIGTAKVFSEFHVTNPHSGCTYRVAIRGEGLGVNYCSCPDYVTNTLGTCKHIEFALHRLRAKARQRAALAKGYVAPFSEVYLRYGAQRHIIFSPGSGAPDELKELAAKYFDEDGVLRDGSFLRFDGFLQDVHRLDHELRCYDDALDFIAAVRDSYHRRLLIDDKYGDGTGADLRGLLKVDLYPYQREGVLFAARAGRALLGDEMGLGKTIQAIGFAELMAREFGVESALIVCPASLKYQWKQEIERFTNRAAVVIEGPLHVRRSLYADDSFFKIVNYDVIHRDLEAIEKASFDIVILDEAQRIKNWKTRTAASVKRIETPYALVLTGTPLENRLEELYSIVQFIDRYRLGPMFRFLTSHQTIDPETGRVVGYRDLASIGETLKPILLRRRKAEVLQQLPKRIDNNYFVPMTRQQLDHHDEHQATVARIVAKWRRYKYLSEADQRRLTIALQYMRMSCDNTYLIDQETRFGPKLDEITALLGELFEEQEAKAVIFSQWTKMNDLLAERFGEHDWGFVYLHGGVPSHKRKDLMTNFRENPDVRVFLSTDAGQTGLNLQMASTIINVDLPWNPAVLEQRIGRVHRIGQQRGVRVVNFVSEGTIEHGMLSVLKFKQSLFSGVLDGGADEVFMKGSRLSKFMESVESVNGAVPETAHEPPAPVTTEEMEPLAPDEKVEPAPVAEIARPEPLEAAAAVAPVLSAGAQFLKELGGFIQANREPGKSLAESFTERDEKTGRTYLKLPMPEPEVVESMAAAVTPLLQLLQAAVALRDGAK